MIRVEKLRVNFHGVDALRLEQLTIEDRERLGVRGPNGSGKSTLLRVLAGLLRPSGGTVVGCPRPGRSVLVHQQPYLFRGTARENIRRALRIQGKPVVEAIPWLDRLGVSPFAERSAKELSGGERRRVALARALAVGPDLLLLDEPFVGLDEAGRQQAEEALAAYGGTLVIAGPELDESLVSRVVPLTPVSGTAVVTPQ